jgi:hypothetical protein
VTVLALSFASHQVERTGELTCRSRQSASEVMESSVDASSSFMDIGRLMCRSVSRSSCMRLLEYW